MGQTTAAPRREGGKINLHNAEEPLTDWRFLKPPIRDEIDEFFNRLPEPYNSFARLRYQQCETMEKVAEELGYSTRHCYRLRTKVLRWWVLFMTGEKCS